MTNTNASTWTPPKKLIPKVYSWTVSEFIKYAKLIDCNPLSQRQSVEESFIGKANMSKAQSIINSIFKGSDIGEIKLADITHENKENHYESIDGGNRKRALIAFINGQFPLHKTSVFGEKKYGQLTKEQRDYLDSFAFRVAVYEDLTAADKGRLFRDTNTVTPVNHMEMLNSFGDHPIANAVRNTARYVPGADAKPHKLFASNITKSKNGEMKEVFENVGFDNKRHRIDEFVARLFYIVYAGNGGLMTASSEQLLSMYEDPDLDEAKVKALSKKVDAVLDFIYEIAFVRKRWLRNNLSGREFGMLYRLYFHYNEKYGKWKINDANAFLKGFKSAMDQFDSRSPSKFARGTFILNKKNNGIDGSARLIHEAFGGYLGDHVSLEKARQLVTWIEMFFDPFKDGSAIVLDKKRVFDRNDIESALIRQMFKDPITGNDLTMHDAAGGHIVAHSKGGKTTRNNLIALSKKDNSTSGAMNALEYVEFKKKKLK